MNHDTIDKQRILAQMRRSLEPRRYLAVPPKPAIERPVGTPPDELAEDLELLQTGFDIYQVTIKAHSKVLGPIVVALRKLARKLLRPVIEKQISYNAANVRVVRGLRQEVHNLQRADIDLHDFMEEVRDHVNTRLEQVTAAIVTLRGEVEQAQREWQRLEATQGATIGQVHHHLEAMRQAVKATREQVARAERQVRRLQFASGEATRSPGSSASLASGMTRTGSAPIAPMTPGVPEVPLDVPLMESFDYAGFLERFAGSEQAVASRFQKLLSHFAGAGLLLDLNCQRGEFLELAHQAGYQVKGLTQNTDLRLLCQEKGLEVLQTPVLPYLVDLPADSVGGVFAAQLLDTLAPQSAIALVQQTYRILQRGGPIVLELLNPLCPAVLNQQWFLDPLNTRLWHPAFLTYLLETTGFQTVTYSFHEPLELGGDRQSDRFTSTTPPLPTIAQGYQFYTIVGHK